MDLMEKYQKALIALNNGVPPDADIERTREGVVNIIWKSATPIDMSVIEQKIIEIENNAQAEIEAKETAKQSAIDKLKALGLTDEEIKAFRDK